MRSVAVVNGSALVGPEDVARCVAALQAQVRDNFAPAWGTDAVLRVADVPDDDEEVLHLLDDAAGACAPGAADRRPRGYVFVRPCLEAGEPWQARASHELLEMLADPLVNLAAEGACQGRPALFALEVCDPVAGDGYEIDGVPVANFVLPTWFARGPLPDDALVDHLGRLAEPFTLAPAGYVSFCAEVGRWQTWYAKRCPKPSRQPGPFSRRRRRLRGA